jgi:hypothetical protein
MLAGVRLLLQPYKTKKHTLAHTEFIFIQDVVFMKLSIAISIGNPRVGGSILPPGTTFQNNINDLIFVY